MPDVFVPTTPPASSPSVPVAPSTPQKPLKLKKTFGIMNPFVSFYENPLGISFQSQAPDEVILLFLRKHFITNVPWIFVSVLLILLPAFFGVIISFFNQEIVTLPSQFILLSILFYYLVVFGYAFSNFITWYYNVLLVTQKEIVDIDYSHLVYHDVAATKVNLVEDVNYIQGGFLRGIFNFGDVFIQTAGGKENIEGHAVPKPATAARIILNLIGRGSHSG